jgi:subtilisin family serine protease
MAQTRFSGRRAAVAACAWGICAAVALPGVATAAPSTATEGRSLTAPAEAAVSDGQAMNYAVNLVEGASEADLATAVAQAEALGGATLAQYPDLATFFVQSASGTFAGDLGNALAGLGVGFDSIGPTRGAAVTGDELLVSTSQGRQARVLSEATTEGSSQLDRESLADVEGDPLTSDAWGLTAIGALEAQDVDVPLEPVTVGVLDTGIDGNHPDLAGQIDASKSAGCAVNGIADGDWDAWQDNHYHGTHVAGTIAAAHNGQGVDGVAPQVTLAAVQTGNADGFFYPEYVTCAFVWAADHDFDVTNNSYYTDPWEYWVPGDPTQAAGLEAVTRAVAYSEEKGVVNVAAAGNSDNDLDNLATDSGSPNDTGAPIADRDVTGGVDIPAQLPGVVTVSSVALPAGGDPATAALARSGFSNYGEGAIDVAAPGSSILSTIPTWYRTAAYGPGYGVLSGTSMASPHTAGVAALIKAIHPDFTPAQTVDLLTKQAGDAYDRLAAPADGKEYRGAGLVNALAAVTVDQPQPTIGEAEYSTDGGTTWSPLAGASLRGAITVRVPVAGPVTEATLTIGSASRGELASAQAEGDGTFGGSVTVSTGITLPDVTDAEDLSLTVEALGRNNDARADDDVSAEGTFTVAAAPAPQPEPSEPSASPATPTPSASASSAAPVATGGLASTGADLPLGLGVAALIAGAATLALTRRSRSER